MFKPDREMCGTFFVLFPHLPRFSSRSVINKSRTDTPTRTYKELFQEIEGDTEKIEFKEHRKLRYFKLTIKEKVRFSDSFSVRFHLSVYTVLNFSNTHFGQ